MSWTSVATRSAAERHLGREIAAGLRLVLSDPLLRVNAIFGCLSNLVLTGYQSILVVYLISVVGLSSGAAGLTLALTGLGAVVGALVARELARRLGTARTVLVSKVAVTPFGLLIPLADRGPGLALFLQGSIMVFGGIVAGNVVWSGFTQAYYPAELQGRMSTSVQGFNSGAIPAGALIAGAVASQAGVRTALWIMLAGLVASSLVLLLSPLCRLRDLQSPAGIVSC